MDDAARRPRRPNDPYKARSTSEIEGGTKNQRKNGRPDPPPGARRRAGRPVDPARGGPGQEEVPARAQAQTQARDPTIARASDGRARSKRTPFRPQTRLGTNTHATKARDSDPGRAANAVLRRQQAGRRAPRRERERWGSGRGGGGGEFRRSPAIGRSPSPEGGREGREEGGRKGGGAPGRARGASWPPRCAAHAIVSGPGLRCCAPPACSSSHVALALVREEKQAGQGLQGAFFAAPREEASEGEGGGALRGERGLFEARAWDRRDRRRGAGAVVRKRNEASDTQRAARRREKMPGERGRREGREETRARGRGGGSWKWEKRETGAGQRGGGGKRVEEEVAGSEDDAVDGRFCG